MTEPKVFTGPGGYTLEMYPGGDVRITNGGYGADFECVYLPLAELAAFLGKPETAEALAGLPPQLERPRGAYPIPPRVRAVDPDREPGRVVDLGASMAAEVDSIIADATPARPTSVFQPWRAFQPDSNGAPYGWIQWKGTNVCMDLHCKCGALGHVDEDLCYYVKCGNCGQVYEVSGHVEMHAIDAPPKGSCAPVLATFDADPDPYPACQDRPNRVVRP